MERKGNLPGKLVSTTVENKIEKKEERYHATTESVRRAERGVVGQYFGRREK